MNEPSALQPRGEAELAAEINIIKRQTQTFCLRSAIEIGGLLLEAKESVSHGEWGTWLEQRVSYSQRTANNMMALHRAYATGNAGELPEDGMDLYEGLSMRQALALLPLPPQERAEVVKEHDPATTSAAELEEAVKARLQAEEDLRKTRETSEAAVAEARAAKAAAETALKELKEKQNKATEAAVKKALKEAGETANALTRELAETKKKLAQAEESAAEAAGTGAAEEAEEKEELVARIRALEEKLAAVASGSAQRFGVYAEQTQETFSAMLEVVSGTEGEEHTRLKNAAGKLLQALTSVFEEVI